MLPVAGLTKLADPTARILDSRAGWIFILNPLFAMLWPKRKYPRNSAAIDNSAMSVANAAPLIPIPKRNIRSQSRKMFISDDMIMANIVTLTRPSALAIFSAPTEKQRKGKETRTILKYSQARGTMSGLPPSKLNSFLPHKNPTHRNMTPVITHAVNTLATVSSALLISPEPRLRDRMDAPPAPAIREVAKQRIMNGRTINEAAIPEGPMPLPIKIVSTIW